MDNSNPFEQLAAEQMARRHQAKLEAARKRAEKRQAHIVQSDADAPMILGPQEQKLADQSKQMRSYRAWKKSEFDAMASIRCLLLELERVHPPRAAS